MSYSGARTARATNEFTPSAPMVTRARSSTARSALVVAAHADDGIAGHQQLVDGERFPNLDTAFRRRLHQQAVEDGATGTEPAHAVIRIGNRAAEREWSDIERHPPADGRQTRRGQSVEKSPPRQDLGAVGPQDVGRDRIAGEGCPVDEQDLETPASQEHGR